MDRAVRMAESPRRLARSPRLFPSRSRDENTGAAHAASCASALEIGRRLDEHPMLERVNYPGLPSHPQHARARRLLGAGTGMLSFELKGGAPAADRFMSRTTLPILAPCSAVRKRCSRARR